MYVHVITYYSPCTLFYVQVLYTNYKLRMHLNSHRNNEIDVLFLAQEYMQAKPCMSPGLAHCTSYEAF